MISKRLSSRERKDPQKRLNHRGIKNLATNSRTHRRDAGREKTPKAPKGRNRNSPGRKAWEAQEPWDWGINRNEPQRGERDPFAHSGLIIRTLSKPGAHAPGYRASAPSGLGFFSHDLRLCGE